MELVCECTKSVISAERADGTQFNYLCANEISDPGPR